MLQFPLRLARPYEFEPSFSDIQSGGAPAGACCDIRGSGSPALLGSETGLDSILAQVLKTVAPSFKVITPQETASLLNRNESQRRTRMRPRRCRAMFGPRGAQEGGTAIGARYVFQPKLTAFMQITKDRWEPSYCLKGFPYARVHATITAIMGYADRSVALDFPGRGKPRERSVGQDSLLEVQHR